MKTPAPDLSLDSELGNLTSSAPITDGELDRAYTRPPHTFKGQALWPYSAGVDLLLAQITDPQDTALYQWLAFIFLHLRRNVADVDAKGNSITRPARTAREDREVNLLPLAWDVRAFRVALMNWMDDIQLTPADRAEAKRLHGDMIAEARRAAVEIVSPGGKKKAERSRPRRRS